MSASSSTSNCLHTTIPIFNGELYEFWSDKMKTLLRSQDLWEIVKASSVESGKTKEGASSVKEDLKSDAYALHLIQQGVEAQIYPIIIGSKTANEAWMRLENEYGESKKVTKIKLQTLKRQFDLLQMKDDETSKVYSARVTNIVNQIRILGGDLKDQQVVEKILRSLPRSYNHIVSAILEARDTEEMSMTELLWSLQFYEDLFAPRDQPAIEKVFQSKMNLKQRQEGKKHVQQQQKNNNYKNKKEGKKNQFQAAMGESGTSKPCFICKKTNHEARDCFCRCKKCKIQNHSESRCWYNNKRKEDAKFSKQGGEKEDNYLFACQNAGEECETDAWFVSSGCSSHMVNNLNYFITLDETYKSEVILGDGKKRQIEGKGTISVVTESGDTKLVTNVQYVPSLLQNFISVGQLLNKGHEVTFDQNLCHIVDGRTGQKIISACMNDNNIFVLRLKPASEKPELRLLFGFQPDYIPGHDSHFSQ